MNSDCAFWPHRLLMGLSFLFLAITPAVDSQAALSRDAGMALLTGFNCQDSDAQTKAVLDSIRQVKSLLSDIDQTSKKCVDAYNSLAQIPNVVDIENTMAATAIIRQINTQKAIIHEAMSNMTMVANLKKIDFSFYPSKEELTSTILIARTALLSLQAELSVAQSHDQVVQYSAGIANLDHLSISLTGAIKGSQSCYKNDSPLRETVSAGLAGIAGFFMEQPLGIATNMAARILQNVFQIRNASQHPLEQAFWNQDRYAILAGVRCAMEKLSKQHCRTYKERQLFEQMVSTENACRSLRVTDSSMDTIYRTETLMTTSANMLVNWTDQISKSDFLRWVFVEKADADAAYSELENLCRQKHGADLHYSVPVGAGARFRDLFSDPAFRARLLMAKIEAEIKSKDWLKRLPELSKVEFRPGDSAQLVNPDPLVRLNSLEDFASRADFSTEQIRTLMATFFYGENGGDLKNFTLDRALQILNQFFKEGLRTRSEFNNSFGERAGNSALAKRIEEASEASVVANQEMATLDDKEHFLKKMIELVGKNKSLITDLHTYFVYLKGYASGKVGLDSIQKEFFANQDILSEAIGSWDSITSKRDKLLEAQALSATHVQGFGNYLLKTGYIDTAIGFLNEADTNSDAKQHLSKGLRDNLDPSTKNYFCVQLMGLVDIPDRVRKFCVGTQLTSGDRVIQFNQFVSLDNPEKDASQPLRACAYQDFISAEQNAAR